MRRASVTTASCLATAVAAALLIAQEAAAELFTIDAPGGSTELVEAQSVGGITYFRLADLALAVGGSRHWNPRTEKMTLVIGSSRVSMTSDSPFVTLDGRPVNLGRPVLLRDDGFWTPSRFLSGPLATALNSEVVIDEELSAVSLTKLGALLVSVDVEERATGTVAVLTLNDRTEFAASSRERGRIDVFMPGAVFPDSALVVQGAGLISSVTAGAAEGGVYAVVRTAPSAKAFDAALRSRPHRIEILVESAGEESIPSPLLRGAKHLSAATGSLAAGDVVEAVMIDPGHGGRDSGYSGPSGLAEKNVVLKLAEELSRRLQREGFYVFMTRSSDTHVPLKRRAEIANLAGADVFVSLHLSSWYARSASGFRVSYYEPRGEEASPPGDAGTRGLRRTAPGDRPRAIRDLAWSGAQAALSSESMALARAIHDRMAAVLPHRDRGVVGQDLVMLAGCSMPAVLIEVAYLSNPSDSTLLEDHGFVADVGRAIAAGVADYRASGGGRGK